MYLPSHSSRPRWRRRRASVGRIVAVNAALVVGVLVVAELVLGGWIGGRNYGTLVIPKDFTRRYDVSRLYGGGMAEYRRDRHGLRGRYADPSGIDILAIGGSTTNEIFVTEGQTWTDRLAQEFAGAGRPLTVVNAGVDGQSTIGNIKNFELWFPRIPGLKARYVLALLGVNDMAVAVSKGFLSKQDRMTDARRPIKQYLLNNSVLYTLFRNVRGIIRARDAKLIHAGAGYNGTDWRLPTRQPDVEAAEETWRARLGEYGERLRILARRIRELGAVPIFVTQARPSYRIRNGQILGTPGPDGTVALPNYALLAAHNRKTMEVCGAVKAICIDLAAELFFEDGDHYDEVHTTPKGSAKIGRYLFKKLKNVVK